MPSPMPGPDPGDVLIGQGRQRNDYLSRVFRQLERYRVYPASARDNRLGGRVVTRVTINRDGRLIDVRIDTSSGVPVIDQAEVEAIRKAAPFPPVPSDMPGDPGALPFVYPVCDPGVTLWSATPGVPLRWDGKVQKRSENGSPVPTPKGSPVYVNNGTYLSEGAAGYSVYEADSMDAAVALAARIPAARLGGAVEVRPAEKYW